MAGALNWVDEPVLAEEMLDRGFARAVELGDPLAEMNVRSVRAWSRISRGRLRLAAEDLDAMLAAGQLGWRSIDAVCAGDDPKLLDESVEVLEHSPARLELAWSLRSPGSRCGAPDGPQRRARRSRARTSWRPSAMRPRWSNGR